MKKRGCTIHIVKTKALISFAVTAKLISDFVFAFAKSRFSHEGAHVIFVGTCTGKILLLYLQAHCSLLSELFMSRLVES